VSIYIINMYSPDNKNDVSGRHLLGSELSFSARRAEFHSPDKISGEQEDPFTSQASQVNGAKKMSTTVAGYAIRKLIHETQGRMEN